MTPGQLIWATVLSTLASLGLLAVLAAGSPSGGTAPPPTTAPAGGSGCPEGQRLLDAYVVTEGTGGLRTCPTDAYIDLIRLRAEAESVSGERRS